MGQRNLDRIPLAERRREGETVGQMLERRWDVVSKCRVCGLAMQVDLNVVALVSGPATSLWNRTPKCRRLLCSGFVDFYAKAPGMPSHAPLRAPDQEIERVPAWRRGRDPKPLG